MIFISHASADKATADAVCAGLEARGLKCWIAPRDIPPGEEFAHAILEGINRSNALVVIYSTLAADSKHVAREVERAVAKDLRVMPLRFEKIPPRGALEYLLSTTQWLDASREPSAAQLDALAQALQRPRGIEPLLRAPRRRAVLFGCALLALAAVAGFRYWPRPAPLEKSVAVLPFSNLSSEKDSQFFADGLQDSVITHLASVSDLKVISRSSVMRYREGDRDVRQIGADLGVANVIEASVQRVGTRLHLNAQLIRTADDSHVWAAEFDRDAADVLKVQSELAEQIALAVSANLTPAERARIARAPTRSSQAMGLYAQAHDIWSRYLSFGAGRDVEARELLGRAIALDEDFAAAYALRALFESEDYMAQGDPSLKVAAQADAARALTLDPELAIAQVAHGYTLTSFGGDSPGAVEAYTRAIALAPNDADAYGFRAEILRELGRYGEAKADFARAAELNPLDELSIATYAGFLVASQEFVEADAAWGRLVKIAANPARARAERLLVRFKLSGDFAPAEAAWRALPHDGRGDCAKGRNLARFATYRREFRRAASLLEPCDAVQLGFENRLVLAGRYLDEAGDAAGAKPWFEKALADADARLAHDWIPWVATAKAEALAGLGRRDAALKVLKDIEASWALPGMNGYVPEWAYESAFAWLQLGDREKVLEMLKRSLEGPGSAAAQLLRLDPAFDPLRDDPRFQKLIADHLPKAPASPLPPA